MLWPLFPGSCSGLRPLPWRKLLAGAGELGWRPYAACSPASNARGVPSTSSVASNAARCGGRGTCAHRISDHLIEATHMQSRGNTAHSGCHWMICESPLAERRKHGSRAAMTPIARSARHLSRSLLPARADAAGLRPKSALAVAAAPPTMPVAGCQACRSLSSLAVGPHPAAR